MPLSAGTRFGPYEVLSALGSGGMGEVYRARDTKLGRDVALKVLPGAVADDPKRLARFRREAQVLASLNHANIAHIHGLEDAGPTPALVMELVEGPTLADRIGNRGLPLADVLAIARQLADALKAAHAQHVIHRDLKPANLKVRPDGTLKVLDFGIAKVLESATSGDDGTTLTAVDTQVGMVIGTPAYMSPEQARGTAVDERADIWAFGCVVFEMLAGRRPFQGNSTSEVLAAVFDDDPDWSAVATAPPAVRRLLRRCLQKDPRRRLADIGDARLEIDDAEAGVDEAQTAPVERPRQFWPALVAGLAIGAALMFGYWRWTLTRSPGGQLAASTALPTVRVSSVTDAVGLEESAAISPDGKMVAFTALNGGRRQIWYRVLARGVSVQVTSDDSDKEQPRWAPDSMTILYLKVSDDLGGEGTLHEVLITGGPSRPIAQAQSGGDISHDGQWIATFQASGETTRLVVLRRDGSFVREVARRIPERGSAWTPRWSPDDQSIAYVDLGAGAFETRLNVVPAAGGPLRALVSGRIVRGLSWLPDGSGMLYASEESTLRYPPTSLLRVSRLADPDNTSQQLSYGMDSLTNPDVHASGLLLATRTTMRSALWKVPVAGTAAENTAQARQLTNETSQVQTPSASKDGQVVYLSDSGGHGNLWVIDADGSGRRQLTFETEPDVGVGVPVWSPDGTMIVYLRTAPGKQEQFLIRPDGTERRLLVDRGIAAAWSPDSQWLYYAAPRSAGSDETCIWKIQIRDRVKQMVRCNAIRPMPGPDGTLFFETLLTSTNGAFDSELRKANPENAEASTLLGRTGSREVSYDSRLSAGTALSPDGRWLASALLTRATANLWKRPTAGGEKQPVTNFHDNATWIVRQVAWSHDSRFLYAAIANVDTDIISMAGLIRPAGKEK